jgi:hypothetical protein
MNWRYFEGTKAHAIEWQDGTIYSMCWFIPWRGWGSGIQAPDDYPRCKKCEHGLKKLTERKKTK